MSVLKIRDENGNIIEIPAFKGDKGDSYILTPADKQEIAEIVAESELGAVNDTLDEILTSQASYLGGDSV